MQTLNRKVFGVGLVAALFLAVLPVSNAATAAAATLGTSCKKENATGKGEIESRKKSKKRFQLI